MASNPKRVYSLTCDMCEAGLARPHNNRSGLCIDCYRKVHSNRKLCVCGEFLRSYNVTGLCRSCLGIENNLPQRLRAEFRIRVKQGSEPISVAAAIMVRDVNESLSKTTVIPTLGSIVIEAVAKQLMIRVDDLTGRARNRRLVHARACVTMIMLEQNYSYPRIGRLMGGRDHSTIINLAKNFDIYTAENPKLKRVVDVTREWVAAKRQSWRAA